jgi:hypothetical protein
LEPLDNFSKYPPFPPKNRIVRGVGGVPDYYFLGWNPNFFVTIGAHAKCKTLRQPLLGELAMSRKKERKRRERGEKNALYSGHLRL